MGRLDRGVDIIEQTFNFVGSMLFTKYHKLKGVNRNIRGVKSKTLIEEKAGKLRRNRPPRPLSTKVKTKKQKMVGKELKSSQQVAEHVTSKIWKDTHIPKRKTETTRVTKLFDRPMDPKCKMTPYTPQPSLKSQSKIMAVVRR